MLMMIPRSDGGVIRSVGDKVIASCDPSGRRLPPAQCASRGHFLLGAWLGSLFRFTSPFVAPGCLGCGNGSARPDDVAPCLTAGCAPLSAPFLTAVPRASRKQKVGTLCIMTERFSRRHFSIVKNARDRDLVLSNLLSEIFFSFEALGG